MDEGSTTLAGRRGHDEANTIDRGLRRSISIAERTTPFIYCRHFLGLRIVSYSSKAA